MLYLAFGYCGPMPSCSNIFLLRRVFSCNVPSSVRLSALEIDYAISLRAYQIELEAIFSCFVLPRTEKSPPDIAVMACSTCLCPEGFHSHLWHGRPDSSDANIQWCTRPERPGCSAGAD